MSAALKEILSVDVSASWLWAQVTTAWQAFANWWRSELFDLLPEPLVAWLGGTEGPVIRLGVETNGVRIEGISATGRLADCTTIAWSDYSLAALDRHLSSTGFTRPGGIIGVVLPATTFFRRSFEIPVRARDGVHATARQELEHRTPFQAENVHLGMVIAPRQKDSQTLTVHQTIVRRDIVEEVVLRLGLALADISFVAPPLNDDDSLASSISLRPQADRGVPFTRRLIHILTMAAVIIAGLDAALLWWRQEQTIAAIEAQTLVVREQALTVSGLEQEIARVQSVLRALEEQRASPSAAELWRETSRILPDNTWVTDWRLRDGSVSIAGYSLAATQLVGLFEKSQLFKQASLDAPITFDSANERERFSLIVRTSANARFAQR
jgi:general secretion pathway protein L